MNATDRNAAIDNAVSMLCGGNSATLKQTGGLYTTVIAVRPDGGNEIIHPTMVDGMVTGNVPDTDIDRFDIAARAFLRFRKSDWESVLIAAPISSIEINVKKSRECGLLPHQLGVHSNPDWVRLKELAEHHPEALQLHVSLYIWCYDREKNVRLFQVPVLFGINELGEYLEIEEEIVMLTGMMIELLNRAWSLAHAF